MAAPLLALSCAALVLGQTAEKPSEHAQTLRVDVDLVLITATVTDSDGRYVTGLRPEHFQIFEDKIEQEISYFSTEDVPLSVGIVFDTSSSMLNKLAEARAAAATFLSMGDAGDEYFLVEFNTTAQLTHDVTRDVASIQSRLLFIPATGMTALYDAVYLGMDRVAHANNSRKALLLITDGLDNKSRYSLSEVKEFAKERDVQVYAIGIEERTNAPYAAPPPNGRAALADLAKTTGGRAFFPDSIRDLEEICAKIAANLKNQYVLGYRSSNLAKDGKWRKIQIKVKRPEGMPRMAVRARTGYYAPMLAKR